MRQNGQPQTKEAERAVKASRAAKAYRAASQAADTPQPFDTDKAITIMRLITFAAMLVFIANILYDRAFPKYPPGPTPQEIRAQAAEAELDSTRAMVRRAMDSLNRESAAQALRIKELHKSNQENVEKYRTKGGY